MLKPGIRALNKQHLDPGWASGLNPQFLQSKHHPYGEGNAESARHSQILALPLSRSSKADHEARIWVQFIADLGQDLRKHWFLEVGRYGREGMKANQRFLNEAGPLQGSPQKTRQSSLEVSHWGLEAGNLSNNPLPPLQGVNSLTLQTGCARGPAPMNIPGREAGTVCR